MSTQGQRGGVTPRWPAAFGAAAAIAALVLLAAAPLWWRRGTSSTDWLAAAAAAALGAVAFVLLRRLVRESRQSAAALDQFSQRLRQGDVGGALRAVRADSKQAPPSGGDAWSATSRFGSIGREVQSVLGERERRWHARMRLSADWHWETDAELRFSWVSRDLASLVKLGVQPRDLIGRRIDAVPVFEPPEGGWGALVERMAHHKALRDLVLEVRRPGRLSVWVALNGRAHRDEAGAFAGYEGVGRDITEQRLAYVKLTESERRHALMAELSVDWYWQTDAEHRIDQFGPVARDLLGDRATEALGQTRWELHPDGVSDAEWAAHRADLDARRPFRGFEYAIRRPGHSLRWISIGGQPRFNARGEFVGYHGVGRDITLRKRAERVLLNRNQALERQVAERTAELEQSNRDLEAFSRQLAHELRTPIGQIAGLADLLKSRAWERLGEDEREWLRLQGQAAREMSHTVTALLELARSASTALLLEAVDLTALAQAVIEDLPWIERQSPVEWVIEPGLRAHCSAALVRVALTNLLGNAAKFTRDVAAPRVEFSRHADSGGDNVGESDFVIGDNGAGFDAECAATLFQPFVRLHRSDQFQGTGLGLSIVRRIVERHGGSIAAIGVPGRGARFVFRLAPARTEEPALSDSTQEAGLSDAAA
ncbi:MAG: PAS domain S-box protein [Burkholderiaceae bacterium]|nr:PAS domain S-box protein [Burkholderiaceae bacterium]